MRDSSSAAAILLLMTEADGRLPAKKLSRRYTYGLAGILVSIAAGFAGQPFVGDLYDWPLQVSVWGTVGQWVGSLLTGVSFFLAYRVYRSSHERERRAQAALVTFDCKISPNRYRGVVYNHSDTIIRDVYLIFGLNSAADMQRKRPRFSKIMSKDAIAEQIGTPKKPASFIAPISETEFKSIRPDVEHEFNQAAVQLSASHEFAVKLVFTDAAGVQWVRYQDDGALEEFMK